MHKLMLGQQCECWMWIACSVPTSASADGRWKPLPFWALVSCSQKATGFWQQPQSALGCCRKTPLLVWHGFLLLSRLQKFVVGSVSSSQARCFAHFQTDGNSIVGGKKKKGRGRREIMNSCKHMALCSLKQL